MLQSKDGVQRLFRQFGLFSLTIALSSTLLAGSFEDFKRSQSQSFKEYKDEEDAKFDKILKEQWKAYKAQKGIELYEKPKPKEIPKTSPKDIKNVGPLVNVQIVAKSKKEAPKEESEEKSEFIVVIQKPQKTEKKEIEFDFFGTHLGFNISKGIKIANFYPTNQKGITNYFNKVASSEYEYIIDDIKKIKTDLNLNDWGVYLLVNKFSKKVYKNDDNSRLLAWFIFNKLGYAVKVGLSNRHVVLLHYSDKTIYSTPNFNFGNNKYYVVSSYAKGNVGRLYSYEQNYPGSDKPLDLSLKTLPNFVKEVKVKEIGFSSKGKEFRMAVEYNQNLLDFMSTYPQADYDTFFNAPMENDTYIKLAESMKKYIDGKKMSDALNFVLHFVQKSFKYQTDDEQFGREKVMFAQETLYYNKSDCEDRSVLFSYLVKELFGIDAIGVKYNDHMAAALSIPMNGDYVKAGRKKFIIADPTYINSNIGESMPKYKHKKPEAFIMLNN